MQEKITYLTREWLLIMQQELEYLKNIKRVEIAEKLKEAIEYWDLSENAEYEEARTEQAIVEKRILEIEDQLKNVEIIDSTDSKKSIVKIWNIVCILKDWEKIEENYKIVWSTETDILDEKESKISNESPVWKSLLWKKKGDIVKIKSPWGIVEYKIINIK